jgi:hypothetical protein
LRKGGGGTSRKGGDGAKLTSIREYICLARHNSKPTHEPLWRVVEEGDDALVVDVEHPLGLEKCEAPEFSDRVANAIELLPLFLKRRRINLVKSQIM